MEVWVVVRRCIGRFDIMYCHYGFLAPVIQTNLQPSFSVASVVEVPSSIAVPLEVGRHDAVQLAILVGPPFLVIPTIGVGLLAVHLPP